MYLAVLVGNHAFYWYEIPYDKAEGDALLEMEIGFWNNYIIPDVRPEPDGSESAKKTLEQIFAERVENTVTLFEQEQTAAELVRVQAELKALESDEKRLKQMLINALEKNERGITESYEIACSPRTSQRVDTKKLKADFPEIYAQVLRETSSNYFTIKERKNI